MNLEHVSLATSADQEWEGEKVNLMTMQLRKDWNLTLSLPGWEEGLFPHQKSLQKVTLLEEERLAYRYNKSKKEAFLSFAMRRATKEIDG